MPHAADDAVKQGLHFDRAGLQQSETALQRGEDQAMQDSLAAANAAAGERVRDSLDTQGSTSHQPAVADLEGHPSNSAAVLPAALSDAASGDGAAESGQSRKHTKSQHVLGAITPLF